MGISNLEIEKFLVEFEILKKQLAKLLSANDLVPYVGATTDVDLGTHKFNAPGVSSDAATQTITAATQTITHNGKAVVNVTIGTQYDYLILGLVNPSIQEGSYIGQTLRINLVEEKSGNLVITNEKVVSKTSLRGDWQSPGQSASNTYSAPYLLVMWVGSYWLEIERYDGVGWIASGLGSHAEGFGSSALYYGDHAEGFRSVANGIGAHAEGYECTASGTYGAHAEGYNTLASASYSHAGGIGTKAQGQSCFTHGEYLALSSTANWSVAFGKAASLTTLTTSQTFWLYALDLYLQSDSKKMFFGQGKDCSIYYNGTNMIIDPRLVGTGSLVIGKGSAGVDYRLMFDGETNDGIIDWMEDEDYFQVMDTIKSAGRIKAITTKTGTYTTTQQDEVILCDGTFTINLIDASVANTGLVYNIKNIGTGTITVDANGTDLIDGVQTQELIQDESITIINNGTNWFII